MHICEATILMQSERNLTMLDAILDALLDTAKLVPFLLLTYCLMEYLEHQTGEKAGRLVGKAGKFGPVVGGVLGIMPQCGFSAAASNLYAGRMITLGTLMAIYLSTSDEMLPILISERVPVGMILQILLLKALIGIFAGLIVDFCLRKRERAGQSGTCGQESGCSDPACVEHGHVGKTCQRSIFVSALSHTVKISLFIFLIGAMLNLILYYVGEDVMASLLLNRRIIGPLLAGLAGLIPNCAGSVILTQLYLQGALGFGSVMAGLLSGSGVGLLVLFRVNHDRRENLKILGLLYGIGVAAGIVIGM